jgi:excisionase family DNA binding protein
MDQSPPPPRVGYAPQEAADALGISRAMIYREMQLGYLPARKMGAKLLILAEDLQAYARALPAATWGHGKGRHSEPRTARPQS